MDFWVELVCSIIGAVIFVLIYNWAQKKGQERKARLEAEARQKAASQAFYPPPPSSSPV
jgi:uncharacterized membrane protein